MLLLRTESLPEGPNWLVELKLDGYRALAIKTGGKLQLRSRNDNDFTARFPAIAKALSTIPDETIIDGEVVALDDSGRPSFNTLQNYGSSRAPLFYYAFDLLILSGRSVMQESLEKGAFSSRKRFCRNYRSPSATPLLFQEASRSSFSQ